MFIVHINYPNYLTNKHFLACLQHIWLIESCLLFKLFLIYVCGVDILQTVIKNVLFSQLLYKYKDWNYLKKLCKSIIQLCFNQKLFYFVLSLMNFWVPCVVSVIGDGWRCCAADTPRCLIHYPPSCSVSGSTLLQLYTDVHPWLNTKCIYLVLV